MQIHEIMTPQAEWIKPDTTLKAAAQRMRDHNLGCLPVGENDRLVGMVTDHDLVDRGLAQGLDPSKSKCRDVMTKGVTWCFDDESVDDILQRMEDKHIHHIPVLSRQKRMIGMLSLSDIALRGPQSLSPLVFKLASRDAAKHAARTQ